MNLEEYLAQVEGIMKRFTCTAAEAAQIGSHHYEPEVSDYDWREGDREEREIRIERDRIDLELKKKELNDGN